MDWQELLHRDDVQVWDVVGEGGVGGRLVQDRKEPAREVLRLSLGALQASVPGRNEDIEGRHRMDLDRSSSMEVSRLATVIRHGPRWGRGSCRCYVTIPTVDVARVPVGAASPTLAAISSSSQQISAHGAVQHLEKHVQRLRHLVTGAGAIDGHGRLLQS